MFQFQNGAIIGRVATEKEKFKYLFQFQNGAIIGIISHRDWYGYTAVSIPKWCDYRSTQDGSESQCCEFQFQNGAIIGNMSDESFAIFYAFQFQNGAIIGPPLGGLFSGDFLFQFQNGAIIGWNILCYLCYFCVSIPKWCDYRKFASFVLLLAKVFQFQNGAIIGYKNLFQIIILHMLFQFQNGAIIGSFFQETFPLLQRFNSKMVRL